MNWWLLTKNGQPALLNLDSAQSVEITTETSIVIRAAENQTITLEGPEAREILTYLMTHALNRSDQS